MINELPMTMLRCLLMTIAIECLSALIIGIRNKDDLIYVILVNAVTNPLVVVSVFLVNIRFGYQAAIIYEYIIEIVVFVTEGLIYHKVLGFRKIHPLIVSLVLNAASYFSGELYNYIVFNFLK